MEQTERELQETALSEIDCAKRFTHQAIGNPKKPIRYVESACYNCGRVRVELYDIGELICEKCGWNQSLRCYKDLDELAEKALEAKIND